MSAISCDVLVVGGGPAGLASAIALRQRGMNVLVADAQLPPIDKACGEGIMPDSRRELVRLGIDLPDSSGATFSGIQFCDEHSSVAADFPYGKGLGIRRTTLHQRLIDHANAVGVRLAWKTIVNVDPGRPIAIDGAAVKYRYLIGADGQSSRVRAWAGLDAGALLTRRFGFRTHYGIAPWSSHVEVHWSSKGQAYVTPVAEDQICVSVMTRSAESTRSEEVIRSLPSLRDRLQGAGFLTRERGAITTTRRLKHVTRHNVALVGDASGSADAVTGEGLGLGFRQAIALADSITSGSCNLSSYEKWHPTVMRLPQSMAQIMLLLDRWPSLRRRALRVFAQDPGLFQTMLDVHLGEKPLRRFLLEQAPGLGLRLLLPSLA